MQTYLRYAGLRAWLSAQGIDVSEATLRRWVSLRRIPFVKPPGAKCVLFDPSRIAQFIQDSAVEPVRSAM